MIKNGFAASGASIFLICCIVIGIGIPIVLQKILFFLGLVILCFIEEVLTRQDVAGIKDFAAINNLAALTAALKELHGIKDTPVLKEFAAIKYL